MNTFTKKQIRAQDNNIRFLKLYESDFKLFACFTYSKLHNQRKSHFLSKITLIQSFYFRKSTVEEREREREGE